jgi:hypothetical protein
MPFQIQLTNLQNVAPGNVATLKVPVGPNSPTYDQIKLVLSGGMLASHILSVRGKANGRIFLDESGGTDLQSRDAYRGVTTDATFVVIDFTEPKARNGAAEQLLASVPGHLLQDLTFEITVSGVAPALGRIKAVAIYRPPSANPYIRKMLSTSQAFAAAGTDAAPNIIYLPTGNAGGKIKRVWIKESVDNVITGVQMRIANNVIHDAQIAELENDAKRNLLVPQATWVVLDFISDGNLAGMLDTGTAPVVELRLATSAAAAFTVYYELIDPIGRL